jgi:hypothetical protein
LHAGSLEALRVSRPEAVVSAFNETVRLFGEMARIVLDPAVRDAQLRHAIYRRIPASRLQNAVEESTRIVRPEEDSGFDFLRKRYGHLRRFVPGCIPVPVPQAAGRRLPGPAARA